ncbi:MAG: TIGR02186 family protein [Asticcacaulis sp.]
MSPLPVAAGQLQPMVSADLTESEIQVRSNFNGARVVLYGAVFSPDDTPPDVVVVVRGPESQLRLIRKIQVAGLWLNSRPVVFEGAPGYYTVASTRPLKDITDFSTRRRLRLGLDHLPMEAPAEKRIETRFGVRDVVVSRLGPDYLHWRRAVIRIKSRMNLYVENSQGVRMVDRGLFRAELSLPSQAPIGNYQVEVLLINKGQVVSRSTRSIRVQKVGLERAIYDFAHRFGWAYGILCVGVALMVGYGASVVMRRS